jgi:hypothetical protein
LHGCTSLQKMSDHELTRELVGVWKKEISSDNSTLHVKMEFKIDHTFVSSGLKVKDNGIKTDLHASGKWVVKNGNLIETITESNFKPLGYKTVDKIISISSKQFTYETELGKILFYKRKQ